jgi:hypothetical protein
MISCPNCGLENLEGSKFCIKCGALLEKRGWTMRCPYCLNECQADSIVCGNCGRPIEGTTNIDAKRERTVPPSPGNQFGSSIVADILWSLITCGIYQLFWQARQMRALNYFLRKERFSFVKWFLLTIITCGIYHIYYEYLMAKSINEVQMEMRTRLSNELPLLSILLSIFGLSIAADAIQQHEINKLSGK